MCKGVLRQTFFLGATRNTLEVRMVGHVGGELSRVGRSMDNSSKVAMRMRAWHCDAHGGLHCDTNEILHCDINESLHCDARACRRAWH